MVKTYNTYSINQIPEKLLNTDIIIWGLSISALNAFVRLEAYGAHVIGFTDSYVKEKDTLFSGCKVFTIEEIRELDNPRIYISTSKEEYLFDILERVETIPNAEIYTVYNIYGPGEYDTNKLSMTIETDNDEIQYVRSHLADQDSITTFNKLIEYRKTNNRVLLEEIFEKSHPQYFPGEDILKFHDSEVFVDAGAYNGDTSCVFSEKVHGKYDRIYLMEPDKKMYHVAKEYTRIKGLHDAHIINKGAYCDIRTLHFESDYESGLSNINEIGSEMIETISIDEMLQGERATYIKMDIEGAEREAIEGCKNTIERWRPKMAISIYHLEDDLWKIPYMILRRWPFYRVYIRHYTRITTETVMYAVP